MTEYSSYDDWYDNGPGSVSFNRRCHGSSMQAKASILERNWENQGKAKKYDELKQLVQWYFECLDIFEYYECEWEKSEQYIPVSAMQELISSLRQSEKQLRQALENKNGH